MKIKGEPRINMTELKLLLYVVYYWIIYSFRTSVILMQNCKIFTSDCGTILWSIKTRKRTTILLQIPCWNQRLKNLPTFGKVFLTHSVYWHYNVVLILFVSNSSAKPSDASVPESYHSKSDDEDEEILGSDDDEQEDPQDYCKGSNCRPFGSVILLQWHLRMNDSEKLS